MSKLIKEAEAQNEKFLNEMKVNLIAEKLSNITKYESAIESFKESIKKIEAVKDIAEFEKAQYQ